MKDTNKTGKQGPSGKTENDANIKKLEDMEKKLKDKKSGFKKHGKSGKPGAKQDPEWTNQFPLLKDLAGTVALNYIAGTALDADLAFNNYATKTLYPTKVIGIPFISHIGNESKSSDPYNTVSRSTWLELHRRYRGMGSYQQSDLGIILMCIEDVFEAIAETERAYGCCYKYNLLNRNVPTTLFKAMKIDLATIQSDMPRFRMRLNTLIQKARVLCLPKGIMFIDRHIEMVSRIFKDSESDRASMILFRRVGKWMYTPTTFNTGSAATFEPYQPYAELRSADELLDDIDSQLEALLNDDDVTRVCSDILAAYAQNDPTSNEVMSLTYLMEDYTVEPEYNETWLLEIHNLTTSGFPVFNMAYAKQGSTGQAYVSKYPGSIVGSVTFNTLYVYQLNNVIQANAYITKTDLLPVGLYETDGTSVVGYQASGTAIAVFEHCFTHPGNYIYDTWKSNLEKDEVFDINALKQHVELDVGIATGSTAKYYSGKVVNFTTELIPYFEMFDSMTGDEGTIIPTFPYASTSFYATAGLTSGFDIEPVIASLMKVDWHPILITNRYSSSEFRPSEVYGDLDNPVVKGQDVYRPISEISRLSLHVNPLCKHLLVVK